MKQVLIFGVGDFARIASVYLEKDSDYKVAAFTVDQRFITGDNLLGKPVVPFESLQKTHPPGQYDMFVAVGFKQVNQARAKIYQECKNRGYRLISYVNSKVSQWGEVKMGDNCFVFENNVIQPFVEIGNDVILWSGNHIGHDSRIGDHCFIASHAVISGNVKIGPYCFVGVNATFRDGVSVAPKCIIGAGALILRDTAESSVYAPRATEPAAILSHDVKSFQ